MKTNLWKEFKVGSFSYNYFYNTFLTHFIRDMNNSDIIDNLVEKYKDEYLFIPDKVKVNIVHDSDVELTLLFDYVSFQELGAFKKALNSGNPSVFDLLNENQKPSIKEKQTRYDVNVSILFMDKRL